MGKYYSMFMDQKDNIVKMTILTKFIYSFIAIPILKKITTGFFTEIDKLMLKFMWKFRGPRRLTLPNFKIYYKAAIFNTVCYWHKNE